MLKSYLEIGVYDRSLNFNKILCSDKVCVDPAVSAGADFEGTSDEYFESCDRKFDLIFIDGLHHEEQVEKDFDNSLLHLNPGGFIVLHDCNPALEKYTHVPRDNKIWCGDVWKFAVMVKTLKGVRNVTADFDHGVMVCWVDETKEATEEPVIIDWKYFSQRRTELLNLVPVNDIIKYLPDAGSSD
ncbi:MAG: class I SAM-dependent methyltransferase [Chitinophagaceae bacterium]|nr:class I SAM-dependent methyltransferase [Chitinophagaceae bacterium]